MECYEYEIIHTTENPILKNVDVSIVLAMKGTNRFVRDPFILNLTKTTIIQWNAGFKNCKKHSSIKKSCGDLVHAYETAFNYLKKYDNVIIFEDDAIVINKELCIYKKIDKFIGNESFHINEAILSFGSSGRSKTYNNDFLKIYGKILSAQGIIYSRSSRNNLLSQINNKGYNSGQSELTSIDGEFISILDNKFIYKSPLIVQTFPETENFKNWFTPDINGIILKYMSLLFYKLVELDIKPDAWHFIYFINSDIGRMTVYLLILIIILFFYNKICL
jgi:hypothetical protein